MLQIQLYIETDKDNATFEEVELFKDESITLTQSIQDVKEISKIFGDYSRTFSVPASKVNNKIFKHFHNFNIDGFDARTKKNGKLFINYKPYKEGKIKFEAVDLKNNKPHTYKLTFFGNTIIFNDLLGDDKLSGLRYLSQLDFNYTDANIASYMADGKDVTLFTETIEDAVVFPLITSTRRLIYDENTNIVNTATIDNVYPFAGTGTTYGLAMGDLKPAIRVYTIIRAVEVQYGIKFSRDFFSTTNPQFYNLYLWLHNKEGRAFEDQDAQYQITGISGITERRNGDILSIKGGFSSNSFVSDYDEANHFQTIRINVRPSVSGTLSAAVPYNLVIKKDGEEFQRWDSLNYITTNGEQSGKNVVNLPLTNGTYTFFIETILASTYEVDITIRQERGTNAGIDDSITATIASAEFDGDIEANVSSLIPDMKIKEFISGLFKMFNLTAFVNLDNEIVVQNLDAYYASSTKVWDITKNIDATEKTVQTVLPFKDIKFTYKGLGSFLAINHRETANKEWGELKTANRSNGELFTGSNYTVEIPFEHFKYEHLFQLDNGVITQTAGKDDVSGVQYGYSVDKSQEPYLGEPLLFYVDKSISNVSVVNRAGTARQIITKPYIPLNSTSLTWTDGVPSPSLNFQAEMSEYQFKPSTETLFKQYYKSYIEDIFNKRRRLTTVKAYLPITMITKLNLADQLIMFDELYRINKITTNFENNLSTLELNNIFVQQVFETLVKVATNCLTADTDTQTADNYNILADAGCETEFTLPNLIEPAPTPPNDPVNQLLDVQLITTAAPSLGSIPADPSTNTSVGMAFTFSTTGNISGLGTIGDTPQVEEYGFLYSTSYADITSSKDIDVLKAIAGVTDVNYNPVDTHVLPGDNGNIYYTATGLTHPTTLYYVYYARTTIDPNETKADAITTLNAVSVSTIAAAVTPSSYLNSSGQHFYEYISPLAASIPEVQAPCKITFNALVTGSDGTQEAGIVINARYLGFELSLEAAAIWTQWWTSQTAPVQGTWYPVKTKSQFYSFGSLKIVDDISVSLMKYDKNNVGRTTIFWTRYGTLGGNTSATQFDLDVSINSDTGFTSNGQL